MHTLITTFKTAHTGNVLTLYGRLDTRLIYLAQDWDSDRLRNVAKKYKGFEGFELRSGRGQIKEKWEYIRYEQEKELQCGSDPQIICNGDE